MISDVMQSSRLASIVDKHNPGGDYFGLCIPCQLSYLLILADLKDQLHRSVLDSPSRGKVAGRFIFCEELVRDSRYT